MQLFKAAGRRPVNKYVRMTSNVLRSAAIINDVISFFLAFWLAQLISNWWIGFEFGFDLRMTAVIILGINFFLIRISRDAYSAYRGQGDDLGSGTMIDFLVATALTTFVIIQFGEFREFSHGFGAVFIIICPILLFLSRVLFRGITRKLMFAGLIGQRVVVYGGDREVTRKVLELLEIEYLPFIKVVGFADDRRARVDTTPFGDTPYIGGIKEVIEMSQAGEVDQLIVALPLVHQGRLDEIISLLSAGAIDICIIPREFLVLRDRYHINYIGSLAVLNVWQLPVKDLQGIAKEVQDRVLAFLGIVLLSPLLLLTALAIKIESKGPILFKQKRFGFNNLEINVLKFRSMYDDRQDESGARRTRKNDPRVTRVGRIIRRFSIDELPQLINVLRGEMSIVGPRPHATQMRVVGTYYHDAVQGYAARHRVKPGITGLAQVRGLRGEIDTMERAMKRVEYDIYYIENWSPVLDMRIIMETIFKLIWDRYAY